MVVVLTDRFEIAGAASMWFAAVAVAVAGRIGLLGDSVVGRRAAGGLVRVATPRVVVVAGS